MVVLLGFMLGLSVAVLGLWAIVQSNETPSIMTGQTWELEGIGNVLILRVLGYGKSFPGYGDGMNVKYSVSSNEVGYCNKWDIRRMGTLLSIDDKKTIEKYLGVEGKINDALKKYPYTVTYDCETNFAPVCIFKINELKKLK